MVAIVSGDSLGLSLSSLATLGQAGSGGTAGTGRNGEQAFVGVKSYDEWKEIIDKLLAKK